MTVVIEWLEPTEEYWPDIEQITDEALKEVGKYAKREFEKTTRTWTNKPHFKIEIDTRRHIALVWTDDKIYGYIDEGTPPHDIVPKRATALRFRSQYVAKTQPRIIGSRTGGGRGDFVFAKKVRHPGIKKRDYSKIIGQKSRYHLDREIKRRLATIKPTRKRRR